MVVVVLATGGDTATQTAEKHRFQVGGMYVGMRKLFILSV